VSASFTFLVVYLGGLVNLPRWVARLTPFGLVQRWPDEAFSWWPWVALVIGGAGLAVAGAIGYRRRDLTV
jgi:ABC-2 type transport system permease protein